MKKVLVNILSYIIFCIGAIFAVPVVCMAIPFLVYYFICYGIPVLFEGFSIFKEISSKIDDIGNKI